MNVPSRAGPGDALLIVDVQNDFFQGGALCVENGTPIIPVLNRWIAAARNGGAVVIASRDWHPPGHCSFRENGGLWPSHCVRNTPGAEFRSDLELPLDAWVISKGADSESDAYSALEKTGLGDRLRSNGITRLWVGGVATEYCVRATVLDALEEGFEVHLISGGIAAVNAEAGAEARALEEMEAAGARLDL